MPIYEYGCSDCGHAFEMIRSVSEGDREFQCPICKSPKVTRLMSVFASPHSPRSSSPGTAPSCNPTGLT
ncbi:MAG: zinc ribbon domain-containing protein [Proteobacteria bacterium]|nr:zinc ribbon domain-containing protein [Pseudomonadota bacterium]